MASIFAVELFDYINEIMKKSEKKKGKAGAALYGNEDCCKYVQNFTDTTNSFQLRGCSVDGSKVSVELFIDGKYKGDFVFLDQTPRVYTIKDVSHSKGNRQVELIIAATSSQGDAYLDCLTIL